MLDFLVGNDALSAIVAFIVVLIPAVLIHELGHFLAAKAVGITILEFGIGMPPRMVKLFTAGGTDYTLNWLPLGGFVRPLGEDMVSQKGSDALEQDRVEAQQRGFNRAMSVNEAKPLPRIFFFVAGALANFLMAFVLFVIIALTGVPEITGGLVSVQSLQADSALADSGLQEGDIIASINGERFVNGDELVDRLYELNGTEVTLSVLRGAGEDQQTITVTFTPNLPAAEDINNFYPLVLGTAANSPAQIAGLQDTDIVLRFNGEPVDGIVSLQEMTGEHLGEEITLTILRDYREEVEVRLTPRANPPQGEGAMGISIGEAGVSAPLGVVYLQGEQRELVPQTFGNAVSYSINRITSVINSIVSIPGQILNRTADPNSLRLTSPLGISQAGAVFLQESIEQNQPGIIIEFMALISLALGFTNLLPIPALDGGRILFVVIELLRGRPIAPEREGIVHLVGLALLLSLMVVVLLNDIANPLTDLLR
ncbi:MAG: RIP metalloprotease RseP [Anaerolinea sp.]|nr:RIP metalloprotease RseP [Anaerolinea sp.]